jgi:acetyl-CoA carboxylase biotin carboxyl carrier protein
MNENSDAGPTNLPSQTAAVDFEALTAAVAQLASILRQNNLDQLEVTHGDFRLVLSARSASATVLQSAVPSNEPGNSDATPDTAGSPGDSLHSITSPMVGTFYESPSPGEAPFVRVGDEITAGQTVAIIEAMKIMNEIVADRPGIVETIHVTNGETVEYGQPLVSIRPA